VEARHSDKQASSVTETLDDGVCGITRPKSSASGSNNVLQTAEARGKHQHAVKANKQCYRDPGRGVWGITAQKALPVFQTLSCKQPKQEEEEESKRYKQAKASSVTETPYKYRQGKCQLLHNHLGC
jgi:hypothetical protein